MGVKDGKKTKVINVREDNKLVFSAYNDSVSFLIISFLKNHYDILNHLFDKKFTIETLDEKTWEFYLDNPTSNISCFMIDETNLQEIITFFFSKI